MKFLGYAVILLIACQFSLQEDDAPMVETPLGRLRGSYGTSRAGRRYMAFTGIPFAKPPIGELRFKAPEPAEPWNGVLDATETGPACLQPNLMNFTFFKNQSEDCLLLDVFTHDTNSSRKAPVLVNIHGGGFIMGMKNMMKPTLLMDEDIVIVTPNYRLSIFGFLTFETKDQPGNQGLKDQVMALRWVKENIASFGGDPDKVTIMGQSAGGASVYHLLLSPLAKGLYHRAVSSSGATLNPWAISPPGLARRNAEKLMKLLNCPKTPEEGLECARNKDMREVADLAQKFVAFQGMDPMLIFSPVLEVPGTPGAFMEAPLSKLETNPVPFMPILSSAEGLFRSMTMLHLSQLIPNSTFMAKDLTDNLEKYLPITLSYWASASNPDEVTKKVWDYYFPGKKELDKSDLRNLTNMYSDAWFNHGIIKGANQHKGPTYFWWVDYIVKGSAEEKVHIGANHCGDSIFIWEWMDMGLGWERGDLKTDEVREITKNIIKMVVRFMETGEPNIPGSDSKWKPWTADENNYLHFDNNGYQMKTGLIPERFKFWESLNFQDNFYKQQ